jgi:hypothetical protein
VQRDVSRGFVKLCIVDTWITIYIVHTVACVQRDVYHGYVKPCIVDTWITIYIVRCYSRSCCKADGQLETTMAITLFISIFTHS